MNLIYPRFQIDSNGKGLRLASRRCSYHSYSINKTARTSYDRQYWWWLNPSTQMTDEMEGLASAEPYSRKSFSGYTHRQKIDTSTKAWSSPSTGTLSSSQRQSLCSSSLVLSLSAFFCFLTLSFHEVSGVTVSLYGLIKAAVQVFSVKIKLHCSGKPGLVSVISSKNWLIDNFFPCSITSYCKTSVSVWVNFGLGRRLHYKHV